MRRRDALKSIGTLAGAGAASRLLAGCGDNLSAAGGPGTGPDAGGDPDAAAPQGITTMVIVMMENRSYDHYLGARALEGLGGDGLTAKMFNPDVDDSPIAVYRETDYCVADPPHGWDSSRVQMNGGANDGFVRAYRQAHDGEKLLPYVMGYFGREDIPFTWAVADQYASCDRWFSSVLGPTWPNRFYLHSGQSGGRMNNAFQQADWPAIQHRLNDAGIPWAYYYVDLPFVALFRDLPAQGFIKQFTGNFFDDAAAGTLPPVTFVDPGFTDNGNDDHPPHHPIRGQAFLASIYAALAASPQWNNSLLVITYDEAGGFFDHVAPPLAADDRAEAGFDQLGFRVPTVVAGPYVKKGHVSSVVRDHASVLAHLGGMLGLEPLTARVAAAADLSELIDQDRLAALDPEPPGPMPAIEVDESTIEAECSGAKELTDIEKLANTGFFPPELDQRHRGRAMLYEIGDALEKLNAGRIRRGR
jgi:phospholipase C